MNAIRFLSLLAMLFAFAPARAASSEDELIGLWGYGAAFGPMLQGELAIEREGDEWRATFGGLTAKADANGDEIAAEFPEGVGKFRGRRAGKAIDGFWIRPGVTDDPGYPGGASQPFSSPLILKPAGSNKWTGDVHPLKVRAKLYLKIFRDEEGRLLGAFRDPYRNNIGGASRFLVKRDGDRIAFGQPTEGGGFNEWFGGAVSNEGLSIDAADLGGKVELRRLDENDITMFFPRPPGKAPYAYKKPEKIADGWESARARDVGLDEAAVERAVRKIIDGDPAARRPSLIHSMLIARKGKLVVEEYFYGWDRETTHDLRSAGKTFSSVLLGAAMMDGVDISADSEVYELFAHRGPFANPDPRKEKITLAHLMTHSSGLDCNDNDEGSLGNEDTYLQSQSDRAKYTLDLPMKHEPGTRYAYCSANTHLAGAAIAEAAKTWLPEYFDRMVARKLGFGRYYWNLTPNEEGYLGGGAFLLPRDLLKVGQAYLDGGVWKGRRIVPEEWVAESTAARIAITPETTGYSEEEFGEYYGRGEDSYAWHLGAIKVGEESFATYAATGNGGQILIVAPELELVAVFTGGNYRQGGIWSRWPQEFIGDGLIAASN